jgi:hypothetical protein
VRFLQRVDVAKGRISAGPEALSSGGVTESLVDSKQESLPKALGEDMAGPGE